MKQSLKITHNNDKISISQEGTFTVESAIALSFELFSRVVLQSKDLFADNKEARKEIYNTLIMGVSTLATQVYPEIEEDINNVNGTPEAFLAHLEEVSKEIDLKTANLIKMQEELENEKSDS